ncbi:unnamed protein product [Amoebophrya sp. A25]|nr:unnamed protein product [Amoebophrya sp. A25]|eukprot:GSA25T00019669001.1
MQAARVPGSDLGYLIHVPPLPTPSGQQSGLPLVIFFHGGGSSADDIKDNPWLLAEDRTSPPGLIQAASARTSTTATFGSGTRRKEQTSSWFLAAEAVVVSPQCRHGHQEDDIGWWGFSYPDAIANTFGLLDHVLKSHQVIDPHRVFLTGLSMGGSAVWDTAAAALSGFQVFADDSEESNCRSGRQRGQAQADSDGEDAKCDTTKMMSSAADEILGKNVTHHPYASGNTSSFVFAGLIPICGKPGRGQKTDSAKNRDAQRKAEILIRGTSAGGPIPQWFFVAEEDDFDADKYNDAWLQIVQDKIKGNGNAASSSCSSTTLQSRSTNKASEKDDIKTMKPYSTTRRDATSPQIDDATPETRGVPQDVLETTWYNSNRATADGKALPLIRYTRYHRKHGYRHGSWVPAYQDTRLLDFILGHRAPPGSNANWTTALMYENATKRPTKKVSFLLR